MDLSNRNGSSVACLYRIVALDCGLLTDHLDLTQVPVVFGYNIVTSLSAGLIRCATEHHEQEYEDHEHADQSYDEYDCFHLPLVPVRVLLW